MNKLLKTAALCSSVLLVSGLLAYQGGYLRSKNPVQKILFTSSKSGVLSPIEHPATAATPTTLLPGSKSFTGVTTVQSGELNFSAPALQKEPIHVDSAPAGLFMSGPKSKVPLVSPPVAPAVSPAKEPLEPPPLTPNTIMPSSKVEVPVFTVPTPAASQPSAKAPTQGAAK